ncbi:ABC transporter ATP-binding protein [Agrobacterium pusense]|uniref:ABC transporter ATP-binding protein n=1 Tax=Agrobacterium pusense TaxID=648995 RepID=UPI00244830D5|nr:ABC transporter ATP-binding protein [Agrobacterium pusense]MDH0872584.1 ABC transporter ATP-binding protein [Agrobacterium pusense]
MSALLKVNSLQSFYGVSQVLHGIDLSLRSGEQVALLGRNGMGKTTFLRSLMGLVPKTTGNVVWRNAEIRTALPEKIAQSGVAYVPEGRGVFGSLSVIENLLMAARKGPGGKQNWTLDRVLTLFPRLAQRRNNGGHQLSGGEQQMLTIGRALMTNPDLILIDEATEGLAPLVAQEIWRTLAVVRSEGIATIVVDKDVRSLAKIADRMVVMSKGKIEFDGPPVDLLAQPKFLERHLGVQ